MKKTIFSVIAAFAISMVSFSCTGSAKTEATDEAADSTLVVVDSVAVDSVAAVVDTLVAE